MKTYNFTLIIEASDLLTENNLDALYSAGCDDATFGVRNGLYFGDFDRIAASFPIAVTSAIEQIESAVPAVHVRRVEPDDLVTASDIAGRTSRTRESIRLLAAGDRGPGGFPPPAFCLENGSRLWRWLDVATWFSQKLGEEMQVRPYDRFVTAFNAALELNNSAPLVADPEERYELSRYVERASRRLAARYETELVSQVSENIHILARQYIEERNPVTALETANKLAEMYVNHPEVFASQALNAMGYIYLRHKQYALAITLLGNALTMASHAMKPIILYNLAITHALVGNLAESRALLDLGAASFEQIEETPEKPYALCLIQLESTSTGLKANEAWGPRFADCVKLSVEAIEAVSPDVFSPPLVRV